MEDHITEERIFSDVNGWRISGGIDVQKLQATGGVKLIDWKVTSTRKVMAGTADDWERQLNVYAYLVEKEKGWRVEEIEVVTILRDWRKAEVGRTAGYPESPIHTVPLTLWPFEQRQEYIEERVRVHKDAYRLKEWGDELPECSTEEMWQKSASFAVMKSAAAKRATRVFTSRLDADALAEQIGGVVVERSGERLRCKDWCEVSRFCSQYRRYLEDQTID